MSATRKSPQKTFFQKEINFFDLWLKKAHISEIWQQSIVPLFSTDSALPRLFASGRYNKIFFSGDEDQIESFRHLDSRCKNNQFLIEQPGNSPDDSIFYYKSDHIFAVITGNLKENDDLSLLTIKLFLWKIINEIRQNDLEEDTIHDEITGSYNQQYLRLLIDMELDRGKRYGIFFSLLFFDLDNLKSVNEQYGHLIGTSVLKEVSGLIQKSVRRGDVVARFGGDEFVLLLLHAHPGEAFIVAERVLKELAEHTFLNDLDLSIRMSASIGISGYPDHGETTDTLIQKADIAMYQVKQSGKNGIRIYKGD